ncbi:MAG TPA: hypothetical protein VMI11_10395 [Actinomycetes bacterium]|nr:hypothetical protein [Actinomycetes bacterium]
MSTSDPAPTTLSSSDVLPAGGVPPVPTAPSAQRGSYVVRRELLIGLLIVGGLALVGILAGLLWAWVAPTLRAEINGSGQVAVLSTEPEDAIAADGWFAIIATVVGLAAGFRIWWQTRGHEPAAVGGIVVGGLVGSLTMLGVGGLMRPGNLVVAASAGEGTALHGALQVHATGVLLLESVSALVLWLVLDLVFPRDRPAVVAAAPTVATEEDAASAAAYLSTFAPPPRHASDASPTPEVEPPYQAARPQLQPSDPAPRSVAPPD